MYATFDWSPRLSELGEQLTFRRVGVFAGGFTLEAIRAVVPDETSDSWDVIDALSGLVDKSLVAVGGKDEPRYPFLSQRALLRREKLEKPARWMMSSVGTLCIFRQFFDAAYDVWPSTPDAVWIALTDRELDNLRAALNGHLVVLPILRRVALAGASLFMWRGRDHHFRDEGVVLSVLLETVRTDDSLGRCWPALACAWTSYVLFRRR